MGPLRPSRITVLHLPVASSSTAKPALLVRCRVAPGFSAQAQCAASAAFLPEATHSEGRASFSADPPAFSLNSSWGACPVAFGNMDTFPSLSEAKPASVLRRLTGSPHSCS